MGPDDNVEESPEAEAAPAPEAEPEAEPAPEAAAEEVGEPAQVPETVPESEAAAEGTKTEGLVFKVRKSYKPE